MKPISTGKDEWWCNWYCCTACNTGNDPDYPSGHIARSFTYCPDCGILIDWKGLTYEGN